MANTVQLTKNGQPVFPVTDESLVMGLNYRQYDSQNPNGMGYLVLKKNKTFAEQVTDTNTIYEIRYDFDLGGASVTIPTECSLIFKGGKVSNGTIVGQGAQVVSNNRCFSNITIDGISSELHSNWFSDDLQDCLGNIIDSTIVIDKGTYLFSKQVNLRQGLVIKGDKYSVIKTSYPLYIGYRVEMYGITIESSAAHALVLDNTWVRNSRTSDYIAKHGIDENRVGAKVIGCDLSCLSVLNTSVIYIVVNPGGVNTYDIHINGNTFGKAGIGIECFNNVSMNEATKPWSTQHTIKDNVFNLCLNAVKYHRLNELQDYIPQRYSFSGINIINNTAQYRSLEEGGATYSTDYFVWAEGVYYMTCKDNRPWDFSNIPSYRLCIYDQLYITIEDSFDALVNYFGVDDLKSLAVANKAIMATDVYNGSHFWTNLPSPINGQNYTILDFLTLDSGRGYRIEKDSTFYTQFGFVSQKEGVLRKSRISEYYIDIEIYFPTNNADPTTIYNGNPLLYRGSFYIRLDDIESYLDNAIGSVFVPVQFININYFDPAYLPKGSIYFSAVSGNIKAQNRTGGTLNVAIVSSGTTGQRPSSPVTGFTYFDTTLGKMIVWNGSTWTNMDGTALS